MPAINLKRYAAIAQKIHLKELLAVLFILVGIYFFRQERHELRSIIPALKNSNVHWIGIGVFMTLIYILLQTGMYVFSFASIRVKIKWIIALELFLKRNFISVFLPAGGVTALAYMPGSLRRNVIHKKEVHQASGIYAFIGIFSLFLVGLPIIIYALIQSQHIQNGVAGIVTLAVLMAGIIFIVYSIRQKGSIHKLLVRLFPSVEKQIQEIFSFKLSVPNFIGSTLFSIGIEATGILHLYIAMLALGVHPSIEIACIGYVVSVILLATSPFLRGLGAVELSLTYILTLYGYTTAQALEITILYRVFEFWLPMVAGLIAFAAKGKDIFLRLAPAVLIFILGLVNIFSVLTPPIASRRYLLGQYIPMETIHASNLLVLFMGVLLLITSAYLVLGLKNAWIIALTISVISGIAHLTKALDWEEAMLAFFVVIVLASTYKQYHLKSNRRLLNIGIITAAGLFVAVIIFGLIGFYFLDIRHFGIDFSWQQSLGYTLRNFFLLEDDGLKPLTRFGKEFLISMKVLSVCTWAFLFYTITRPLVRRSATASNLNEAQGLLELYGSSSVDYFKTNDDKLIFIPGNHEGFVAYRIANGFAIVLEEPVCAEKNKLIMIREFEKQCKRMGLRPAFYRVDEDSMYYFDEFKKKKLLIGQEAVMDIRDFTLEGRGKKSLRNALNSLTKKGYKTIVYEAPLSDELIKELKKVSDQWLVSFQKKETIFAQGMFNSRLIRQHDIISIRNTEGDLVAFLNIIPDYAPGECTYDLIRKTRESPGGCMDALVIELIHYAKTKGFEYLNLGLVPMSGIAEPGSMAEQVVKFAYEKIKRFRHYQGLRDFKEKYATEWLNKYLVYENDFDLIQLPAALYKVMQPKIR
jgi:phosphatidylglycerol lysyltransferase